MNTLALSWSRLVALLYAGALLLACSPDPVPARPMDAAADHALDASADGEDAAVPDVTADLRGPDAADAADDSAVDAMGPWDPCAPGSLIDLNARGATVENVTSVTGDTSVAGPGNLLLCPCAPGTAYQVALRYVPRATGVLRVSTANGGTAENFDVVAWAQDRCASLRPDTPPLGCNDNGDRAPLTRAAEFYIPSAAPGVPVFIVVAGHTPPSAPWTDRGAFALTVTEVPGVPTGAACDPSGVANVCLADSACALVGGVSTCAPPGARGGRCRVGATPCDAGLNCRGTGGEATSRCRATVFVGGNCDPSENADLCYADSSCVTSRTVPVSACVSDGRGDGARCRASGTACNPGFACDASNRCRTALRVGSVCDPARLMNVCAVTTSCVPQGDRAYCEYDGALGGRCRTEPGQPPCDRSLICVKGLCRLSE